MTLAVEMLLLVPAVAVVVLAFVRDYRLGAVLNVIACALALAAGIGLLFGPRVRSELVIVDTMHQRKAAMADLADGFIMLPGGFGTLDEFFEVVTWTQLGVHAKPCGLLDVNGFFEPLGALLDGAVRQRFIRAEHREMLITVSDPDALLDRLAAWTPISVEKWLDRSER